MTQNQKLKTQNFKLTVWDSMTAVHLEVWSPASCRWDSFARHWAQFYRFPLFPLRIFGPRR